MDSAFWNNVTTATTAWGLIDNDIWNNVTTACPAVLIDSPFETNQPLSVDHGLAIWLGGGGGGGENFAKETCLIWFTKFDADIVFRRYDTWSESAPKPYALLFDP